MAAVYSVTQINTYIKNMFSTDYLLREVQVRGELSNVKYHSSGHIYFTLKDEGSAIAGVMFKTARAQGLGFTLENGQGVQITGSISVYERDGRYQIYAKRIEPDGRGSLYEAYELLKQRLYEEGLFEFEHKKEIPKYPARVGIVTAPTGAAIRDIQNIATRRNPYVQLYLYPAKVQGEGAAQTIVRGIRTLDRMGMDTIIIGRGGGSIEDLWPFNEECVARAIYDADTPIISGTGHEIDNTIADYAADLRAPTPSAACELAIPDVMSVLAGLAGFRERMDSLMRYRMEQEGRRWELLRARLSAAEPGRRLENQMIYLDSLTGRLGQAAQSAYERRKHRYELLLSRLSGISPTAKLNGGYGYISHPDGAPVTAVSELQRDSAFRVTLWDGTIEGQVTGITKTEENTDG